MPDPELEIRGDPVIQTLRKGGGGVQSPQKIFPALRASVWSKTKRGCPPRPLPWVRHWSPNSPSLWVMRQKQRRRRLVSNRTLCKTAQIRKLYSISCSYVHLKAHCIDCCIERICTYRSPVGLFSLSPTCICHLHIFHNTPSPCLPSQILHKHCLQFLFWTTDTLGKLKTKVLQNLGTIIIIIIMGEVQTAN